ncbi:MAG TPA: hypothetical protein PLB97_03865 [Accumulibacter sp.]|jgi:hypothetical protein|nr:hypothetical protein [Accumulibacter sp.]
MGFIQLIFIRPLRLKTLSPAKNTPPDRQYTSNTIEVDISMLRLLDRVGAGDGSGLFYNIIGA